MSSKPLTPTGLEALTGKDRRRIKKMLEGAELEPVRVESLSNRQAKYYEPKAALPIIYAANGSTIEDERAAKTRKEVAQAEKTEIEVRKLLGELVDAKEMEQIYLRYVHNCKNKFLSLPARISPYLEGADRKSIQNQLNDAIYESLTELSAEFIESELAATEADSESVGGLRTEA